MVYLQTGRPIGLRGGLLTVLRTALRMALIGVGTVFVGIAGSVIGFDSTDDLSALFNNAVVMRSVFLVVFLLVMTRAFRVRDRRAADEANRPYLLVLIAAGVAFALNLATWSGQVLFGQLLLPEHRFSSALVDFAMWMAVAVFGVLLGERARVQAKASPAPYA